MDYQFFDASDLRVYSGLKTESGTEFHDFYRGLNESILQAAKHGKKDAFVRLSDEIKTKELLDNLSVIIDHLFSRGFSITAARMKENNSFETKAIHCVNTKDFRLNKDFEKFFNRPHTGLIIKW